MKSVLKLLLVAFTSISLISCQQGSGNKQTGGTLLGGLVGGLAGSTIGKGEGRLVATGIGAIAGALIGSSVGKSMDDYDRHMLQKSSHQALEFSPAGSRVEWQNPDSGNRGSITPTRTFKEHGRYCREYNQEVIIGGEKQKAYGKACRQADGTWKIIK